MLLIICKGYSFKVLFPLTDTELSLLQKSCKSCNRPSGTFLVSIHPCNDGNLHHAPFILVLCRSQSMDLLHLLTAKSINFTWLRGACTLFVHPISIREKPLTTVSVTDCFQFFFRWCFTYTCYKMFK